MTTQPDRFSITLIGPGGAGKTTVGALLADRLRIAFVDLDYRFADRTGDISEYITRFGYAAYARENVQTYRSLAHDQQKACVFALSSGFMTYPLDVHPEYPRLRQAVKSHDTRTHSLSRSRGVRRRDRSAATNASICAVRCEGRSSHPTPISNLCQSFGRKDRDNAFARRCCRRDPDVNSSGRLADGPSFRPKRGGPVHS